jgi:hypothetical protein
MPPYGLPADLFFDYLAGAHLAAYLAGAHLAAFFAVLLVAFLAKAHRTAGAAEDRLTTGVADRAQSPAGRRAAEAADLRA